MWTNLSTIEISKYLPFLLFFLRFLFLALWGASIAVVLDFYNIGVYIEDMIIFSAGGE